MKFHIVTLGCKVNAYESEIITEKFIQNNFTLTPVMQEADIVIINTCSVTNVADNKSKKIIRKVRRENPHSVLVVCGCMSQNHGSTLESLDIDILIGNKDKSKIVNFVQDYLTQKQKQTIFYDMQQVEFEDMQIDHFSHTRAYIKIQDGCDNYCSYCIIPYLRGKKRCKDFATCINEAKILSAKHQEIVLTGIHTGSYCNDNHDLTDLILQLAQIDNLKRIRISSIEALEITPKFLDMLKNTPKVCDHLHIPLQSGSNQILKLMNRRYNKETFLNIINNIRKIRPDISITTDLIVGFPQETEELFQETYEFLKLVNFSKIHVFPFSLRNKTKAEELPEHINNKIKKIRCKKIIELSNQQQLAYYQRFVGQKLFVLIEKNDEKYSYGHTSNYLPLKIDSIIPVNTFCEVLLTEACQDYVYATIKKVAK